MKERRYELLKRPQKGERFLPMSDLRGVIRRRQWLLGEFTLDKGLNLARATISALLRSTVVRSWPVNLKIDISPLCNLRCTACLHAEPQGNPVLERQYFRSHMKMSVDQFRGIVNEIKGKVSSISLYYFGDPLVHPRLVEMLRIASDAGISTHMSTSGSVQLSDDQILNLVKSGLTHITICLDGITQESYQKTRVGGDIHLVLMNIGRICQVRSALRQRTPIVEVQYLLYPHNRHEVRDARQTCLTIGVDAFTTFHGINIGHSYLKDDPSAIRVLGYKPNMWRQRCFWPYYAMLIKYNGDVIPCCNYRVAGQYARETTTLTLGNVFQTGVYAVWTSSAYQEVRAAVAHPERLDGDCRYDSVFCAGCPMLFVTRRLVESERCQADSGAGGTLAKEA